MEHLFGVFAVWAIVDTTQYFLEAPVWFWRLLPFLLGVATQALLDPDWELLVVNGLGIGGASMFVMTLANVLLVTGDRVRFDALDKADRRQGKR